MRLSRRPLSWESPSRRRGPGVSQPAPPAIVGGQGYGLWRRKARAGV